MMQYWMGVWHLPYGQFGWFTWLLLPAVLWELGWKGWALWRAAERKEVGWFVALLLINSLGLLPIIYLFFVTNAPYGRTRVK